MFALIFESDMTGNFRIHDDEMQIEVVIIRRERGGEESESRSWRRATKADFEHYERTRRARNSH